MIGNLGTNEINEHALYELEVLSNNLVITRYVLFLYLHQSLLIRLLISMYWQLAVSQQIYIEKQPDIVFTLVLYSIDDQTS